MSAWEIRHISRVTNFTPSAQIQKHIFFRKAHRQILFRPQLLFLHLCKTVFILEKFYVLLGRQSFTLSILGYLNAMFRFFLARFWLPARAGERIPFSECDRFYFVIRLWLACSLNTRRLRSQFWLARPDCYSIDLQLLPALHITIWNLNFFELPFFISLLRPPFIFPLSPFISPRLPFIIWYQVLITLYNGRCPLDLFFVLFIPF